MDEKRKRTITLVLVLGNVVLWSIFIVPRIQIFSTAVLSNLSDGTDTQFIRKPATSREILERIDFYTLRDPFLLPREATPYRKPQPKPEKRENIQQSQPEGERVQRNFVSRFKLKSIVKIDEKFIATLEEASHYGSDTPSTPTPYSYRFNYEQQSTTPQSGKTYMVIEGDNVMGEQVAKITADFVVLSKMGQYYKLTFTGGFSVANPN